MRFVFDNNLPPALAARLDRFVPQAAVEHLTPRFPANTPDRVWIPALAADEEPPFIVTRDGAINRRDDEVSDVAAGGLTVFFLLKPWPRYALYELTWRLFKLWPAIVNHALQSWDNDHPAIYLVHGEKITRDVRRHRPR